MVSDVKMRCVVSQAVILFYLKGSRNITRCTLTCSAVQTCVVRPAVLGSLVGVILGKFVVKDPVLRSAVSESSLILVVNKAVEINV